MDTAARAGRLHAAAILFDFDGVLFDTTRCVDLFWRQWAAEAGIPFDRVMADVHGRREVDTIRALAPDRVTTTEAYYRDRPILAEELTLARPYAAALPLLADLPAARVAIVTSGHRRLLLARLEHAGARVPAVTVTADDVSAGKPAPEPYLRAAERLGHRAADCVVIEDAPPGITAGKAAGARVIAVATTHAAADLGEADLVVPSLDALSITADASGLMVALR